MEKNNKIKLQTEFDISEDNYEMYDRLYHLKKDILYGDLYGKSIALLCAGSSGAIMVGAAALSFLATSNLNLDGNVIAISTPIVGIASLVGSFPLSVKVLRTLDKKHFKKLYPDANLDVDVDSLEYALDRYNNLKKVPSDLDKLKDEKMSNYSDKEKELSVEEKIAYFKEQKEFWEKVLIQEKYKDMTLDNEDIIIEKPIQKKKEKKHY